MIDSKLVRSKLEACHIYLKRLEPLARLPYARFSRDYVRFNAAERLIQLTVDAAVDINNHLILEAGQPAARDYYSSFSALARLRVLPSALARSLSRTTGLRNRLVHAYEEIDLEILHRGLPAFLRDYGTYVRAVRRYAKT